MMLVINNILRRFIKFFGSLRLALGSLLFAGLLAAVAALFFFGWLADEMLEGDTARFDETIRNSIHELASPALTSAMHLASFVGSTAFLLALGAIIVVWLYLRKYRRGALLFAITTVGSSLLISLLKLAFRRARPEPFFETILPGSYSFPSGHSLGSFCFYGSLAAILAARTEKIWLKIVIWVSAALLISTIGISRIYLGVHYPSDVLAGFVVGLIWVITIAVGDKLIHVREESEKIAKEKLEDARL